MGRKAQRNARKKAGTTYKLQNLSRYGKKTCQFLNQVGVTKVAISFKKKCQSLATKKPNFSAKNKIRNLKDLHKNAKLNNSNSGAALQTPPLFDLIDESCQVETLLNLGFARQTSEHETISLHGGSSSLTNSTDSSRSSDGKMYSFYKIQEILRRDQVKPSLKKKRLLKFHSIYDPQGQSKFQKILIFL